MLPENTRIYSVTDLTRMIKHHLEQEFPLVWISGEISNLRNPHSGHCYFTLKDQDSQLRAVIFRSNLQALRLKPAESLKIICRGQLTVYEPRGEYQLLVDYLEPLGMGALAQAYEQLKTRLAIEGLFDSQYKRPIPFLPRRLAVVTSPSGAAIRDFSANSESKVSQTSKCCFIRSECRGRVRPKKSRRPSKRSIPCRMWR